MTTTLSQAIPGVLPETTEPKPETTEPKKVSPERRDKNGIRVVAELAFNVGAELPREHDWNRLETQSLQVKPDTLLTACALRSDASAPTETVLDGSDLSGASLRRFSGLVAAAKSAKLPESPDGGLPLSQGASTTDPAGFVLLAWERLGRLFAARRDLRTEWGVLEGMTGAKARQEEKAIARRLERLTGDMVRECGHLDAVLAWRKGEAQ